MEYLSYAAIGWALNLIAWLNEWRHYSLRRIGVLLYLFPVPYLIFIFCVFKRIEDGKV